MLDIGRYEVFYNETTTQYHLSEILTGRVKMFDRITQMMKWIEQDIKSVEVSS